MNISYKSIRELRDNGLNIFSIFIRPESENEIKKMLKLRKLSDEEYTKRLKDYYDSELFLEKSKQDFDMIFKNSYDNESLEEFCEFIKNEFIKEEKDSTDFQFEQSIEKLLLEDRKLENDIIIARELSIYEKREKNDKEEK